MAVPTFFFGEFTSQGCKTLTLFFWAIIRAPWNEYEYEQIYGVYGYTGWWQLKYFLFPSLPGEMKSKLTNIFQMGWFNHQLDIPFFSNLPPFGRGTLSVTLPPSLFGRKIFNLRPSLVSNGASWQRSRKGKSVANVASLLMQVDDFEW